MIDHDGELPIIEGMLIRLQVDTDRLLRQVLVLHRAERYAVSVRRPGWSLSPRSAATRALARRTIRECLERRAEQYTAPG
ncbi:hypothetical protein HUT05_00010 [Streptomyces chartreusis]|uniref:Uncharacterized protein n=1 Tax=Streptomyces chartreusis TaxID=1969 RepID=A0A7I0Y8T6_STRCX|nr:hypothetical protein HUT05_00010 [Streptomyces chartreusis]